MIGQFVILQAAVPASASDAVLTEESASSNFLKSLFSISMPGESNPIPRVSGTNLSLSGSILSAILAKSTQARVPPKNTDPKTSSVLTGAGMKTVGGPSSIPASSMGVVVTPLHAEPPVGSITTDDGKVAIGNGTVAVGDGSVASSDGIVAVGDGKAGDVTSTGDDAVSAKPPAVSSGASVVGSCGVGVATIQPGSSGAGVATVEPGTSGVGVATIQPGTSGAGVVTLQPGLGVATVQPETSGVGVATVLPGTSGLGVATVQPVSSDDASVTSSCNASTPEATAAPKGTLVKVYSSLLAISLPPVCSILVHPSSVPFLSFITSLSQSPTCPLPLILSTVAPPPPPPTHTHTIPLNLPPFPPP